MLKTKSTQPQSVHSAQGECGTPHGPPPPPVGSWVSWAPLMVRALVALLRVAAPPLAGGLLALAWSIPRRFSLTLHPRRHSQGDEEPPSGGTAAPAAEDDDRFAKWAWFCLHRDQSPRRECIKIVTQPWFDHSILILILLNSVTMTVRTSALSSLDLSTSRPLSLSALPRPRSPPRARVRVLPAALCQPGADQDPALLEQECLLTRLLHRLLMGSRAVGPRALAKGVRASPRTQNDTSTQATRACHTVVPFRHAWTHAVLLPARSDAELTLRLYLPSAVAVTVRGERTHALWPTG